MNVYDQGWYRNLSEFFGNSILLFWVPIPFTPANDCTYKIIMLLINLATQYNVTPSATMGELMALRGYRNYENKEDYLKAHENILKDFFEKAHSECKNKNLQIAGRIFQNNEA